MTKSRAHHRVLEGDVGVLLRLYGYNDGPAAVDTLLDYLRRPPVMPDSLAALADPELADLGARLSVKASVLSHQVPANEATLARLLVLNREFGRAGAGQPTPIVPVPAALDVLQINPHGATLAPAGARTAERHAAVGKGGPPPVSALCG
jgi:hypothetical protein